jgi:hypothetical protein
LNGPAYTPDQMALMQTQASIRSWRQRDQEEQHIIARFAQQGMGPSSGPVQAAILANRQKYEQLGTTRGRMWPQRDRDAEPEPGERDDAAGAVPDD